jgi:outer membrane protein TolC
MNGGRFLGIPALAGWGFLGLVLSCGVAAPAEAQISFSSAIDLALKNSPRVQVAQDDVKKAAADLAESKSVFIPSVVGSGGAGGSSGITLSVPTIFTISAQSLVLNYSQHDYIRASERGVEASKLALQDVQQQVAEDTAETYLALDADEQRRQILGQQYALATELVSIVQQRAGDGVDAPMQEKEAQRSAVQSRLAQLQLDDDIDGLREHLGSLLGISATQLHAVHASIPTNFSAPALVTGKEAGPDSPSVLSAEADAHSKLERAYGDARYTWRPQITFQAQYGRISPINNVATYYNLRGDYNSIFGGVEIQLPFLDETSRAKARESMAEALHAQHEADFLRAQQEESRARLTHAVAELQAKEQLAELDLGIAQDQLNATNVQAKLGTGDSAPPITPEDEQKARIDACQKQLDVIDAQLELRKSQVSLLRQTGQLENWLHAQASPHILTP